MLSLLERTEPPGGEPASLSSCWQSPSWRCMVNHSCCASRVRPPRLAAAASSVRRCEGSGAPIRPRSPGSSASARNEPTARLRGALASLGTQRMVRAPHVRTHRPAPLEVESSLASLAASGCLVELPVGPRRTIRVLDESVAVLEDRILRALARLHEAHPRQSTIPRARLEAALPDLDNKTLVAALIDRLKDPRQADRRPAHRRASRS